MKNRIPAAFITIGMAFAAATALAGSKVHNQVVIDDSSLFAYGDLGAVRATSDNLQLIGCYTQSSDSYDWGWCQALDSNGVYRGCFVDNPHQLANIRSINGDSHLSFQWSANFGMCTSITVENGSHLDPKT